jgi:putative glutamine amidotransferase
LTLRHPFSSGHVAAMTEESLPVIGIPCAFRRSNDQAAHSVIERYVLAVADGARGLPLLLPAIGARMSAAVLDDLDGLFLTGAPSNIEPRHYGGPPAAPGTAHDPARDATTLPLIRAAVAADLPILGVCLGMQELNVALGGSLHQRVHEVPGRRDHRAPEGASFETRYAYGAHPVALTPGGYFAELARERTLAVNSVHSQGVDRLAPGLALEAVADDGQIEGMRLPAARFVVGVQWHPEYRHAEIPFSAALFAAFGAACRARAAARRSR